MDSLLPTVSSRTTDKVSIAIASQDHTIFFISRDHIPNTHGTPSQKKKTDSKYQTNCHSAYGN